MDAEERHMHWQEGHKYALEGMKSLLFLNGGAAIALLTFFGNRGKMLTTASAEAIGAALMSFSVGTTFSALLFIIAYLTQLHYGNSGYTGQARHYHNAAYFALAIAVGGFIFGIWYAKFAVVSALT